MGSSGTLPAFDFPIQPQQLSELEQEVFNGIVDRLPDHEVILLLQSRRRWHPRSSISTASTVSSRSSVLSSNSFSSSRRSTRSSRPDSSMSVDGYCVNERHLQPCTTRRDSGYPINTTTRTAPAERRHPRQAPDMLEHPATGPVMTGIKPKYYCTYCAPAKLVTFTHRSDWKKHETLKHEPGKLYICAHSKDGRDPCTERFHSLKTVQEHHSSLHEQRGCSMRCSASRISLKTVFACGFRGCHRLFLTLPSKEMDVWDERCKHVGEHFERGAAIKDWDYSRMILNLLQQDTLCTLWGSIASQSDHARGLFGAPNYHWNRSTTESFCNKLETTRWRNMDSRLSLHLNAVKFLGELYKELVVPAGGRAAEPPPDLAGQASSHDTTCELQYSEFLQEVSDDPEIAQHGSNGEDLFIDPMLLMPSPATQQVRAELSLERERKKSKLERTASSPLDALQQQTMELLKSADEGWTFDST